MSSKRISGYQGSHGRLTAAQAFNSQRNPDTRAGQSARGPSTRWVLRCYGVREALTMFSLAAVREFWGRRLQQPPAWKWPGAGAVASDIQEENLQPLSMGWM